MRKAVWFMATVAVIVALGGVASVVSAGKDQIPKGRDGLVTITGTLVVRVHDRFETGETYRTYMIREDPVDGKPGRLLTLELPGIVVGAPIGRRIQVSGVLLGEQILMRQMWSVLDEDPLQSSARKPGDVEESHAAEVSTYKTVVILVNFNDLSLPASCSQSGLQDACFAQYPASSAKGFYWSQSFHQFNLEGVVVGPYTLESTPSSNCSNFNQWSKKADQKARADVPDFNSYNTRLYIIPRVSGEAWCETSWGYIGFGQAVVIDPYCTDPAVIAHELGHNLGLDHASKLNSSGGLCDGCDFSSTMGGVGGAGTLRHFNAPHKVHLDWVPAERTLNVTQTGLYTVSLLEQDIPGSIQVLTFDFQGSDPYYVSYRTGIATDAYAANISTNYRPKMNVHRFAGGTQYTYFLGSDAQSTMAFSDGQTWTAPGSTVCVTMESHTDETAAIWVDFDCADDSPPCPAVTPCTGNCGVTGTQTGEAVDTGDAHCETSSGTHFGCVPGSGDTIHVVSTNCNWLPCCTASPACVCPLNCPGGQHLECRPVM